MDLSGARWRFWHVQPPPAPPPWWRFYQQHLMASRRLDPKSLFWSGFYTSFTKRTGPFTQVLLSHEVLPVVSSWNVWEFNQGSLFSRFSTPKYQILLGTFSDHLKECLDPGGSRCSLQVLQNKTKHLSKPHWTRLQQFFLYLFCLTVICVWWNHSVYIMYYIFKAGGIVLSALVLTWVSISSHDDL